MSNTNQEGAQVHNNPLTSKEHKIKINDYERKINVKGITLKEYFRLCDNQELNQIKEESVHSSKSSLLQTPMFNNDNGHLRDRIKFKTELAESENENIFQSHNFKSPIELQITNRNNQPRNTDKSQKEHLGKDSLLQKKEDRKRVYTKIHSQSTKHQFQMLNRSTLNTFYQIEENKKKMLKKIQADRDKVHDLTLKEALSITKYGSRFNIETKL